MTSQMMYQTVGNAVAQWEADSPLRWTMREPARKRGLTPEPVECDLSPLADSYDDGFLLAIKDALIHSRHRRQLTTIETESTGLRRLLEHVYSKGLDRGSKVRRIDSGFVVALQAEAENIPANYLATLKRFYQTNRYDEHLFEKGLHPNDFPSHRSKRGFRGDQIDRILAKALNRSTLVHVLDVTESAFEEKRIDLARYAFTRLSLNVFCRSDSYRRLTLADLRVDKNPQSGVVSYFLDVTPAKSRVHDPSKIAYPLHPDVGMLLSMQRQSVVQTYGHLAPMSGDARDHGRLALFPAIRLTADKSSWVSKYANAHEGMSPRKAFKGAYMDPIRHVSNVPLTLNALRHTIGTQLAQMGCSATTIQAVLKHASDSICRAYVDIAFGGLIDKLSEGMQSGFNEHFPVIAAFASKADAVPTERRIVSEDLETNKVETTAVCGRSVACAYAPIACYACARFIPCYDADHTVNLKVVEQEIALSEDRGLAMEHDVKRWKTIRNHIRVVIAACDNKRRAVEVSANAVKGRVA